MKLEAMLIILAVLDLGIEAMAGKMKPPLTGDSPEGYPLSVEEGASALGPLRPVTP